jgi:hypothetical protein
MVNDFGIVVDKSEESYCPKTIGFTLYDANGQILHCGRHKFSLSRSSPRVHSYFFLCVMKGNQSAAVRSIKINIFGCVDSGCDCIVKGIIARKSASVYLQSHGSPLATDILISRAVGEVFVGVGDKQPMLSRLFEHIELFTNPSIVSRGIVPVKSKIVESAHPASIQGGTFIHTICFPGASKLTVKFDKRSGKGSGNSDEVGVMKVNRFFRSLIATLLTLLRSSLIIPACWRFHMRDILAREVVASGPAWAS